MGTVLEQGYGERFSGVGRLYGRAGMERLSEAHVCVIGVGGVGSWTVEALARSGVGRLTLIDLDDVCVTNTNRQLHALDGAVGRPKVAVMAERVGRINPGCQVRAWDEFFTPSTAEEILAEGYDYVVDAIDQAHNKVLMIARCRALGIPVVTVGAAGGKRDPGQVRIADLTETTGDRLLRRVRKELRQKHGFPRGTRRWKLPCVFSTEAAMYPTADGSVCDTPDPEVSLRLDCSSGFGTATFVTGTFGFMAASVVVSALASHTGEDR